MSLLVGDYQLQNSSANYLSTDTRFSYVGEHFDNIGILCLIYTMYGIAIQW